MTRTHPNQSLDALITQVILNSIWYSGAFPYIKAVWKAIKLQYKNVSFKSALLIPTVSTNAWNVFYHVSSNSVYQFSAYKTLKTHTYSISSDEGASA